MTEAQTHYRACNLCEAICGLEIKTRDGVIESIRGDADDPLSRGHICPKAVALQDIHQDPDRLRHPMLRRGDSWQRIPWDEAFDLAASKILDIQRRLGNNAVGVYLGNPNVHNYGSLLYGPPLLRSLRTQNRFSATSVDQLPHHLSSYTMFGHQLLLPVPDLDRTQHLLVLGGNPAVSNGSMMTSPDIKKRLKAIRQRGGRIVVIDPRRTETANLADEHHFVRPGTDALLLAAWVATVFEEGLDNLGHLAANCDGLEEVRQRVASFTPESVASAVGIDAATIRRLVRDFCAVPEAVCYGRMGVSVQEFGGLCQWLVNVLNIITGHFDRQGGAMFTTPAVDLVARPHGAGSWGRWKSRVRGLPEFGGELPVSVMAEEINTPGEGQIRALITSAGNPVLSTPNGRQLEKGLEDLEFMVSIDIYINETTRHADLILPPTAALEHDHYDLVFHGLAVRNTARYSPALFPAAEDTRHDWQIFSQLLRRVSQGAKLRHRFQNWAMGRMGPAKVLDRILRQGPHGLRLRQLEEAPHGIDLGPLEPCMLDRLKTSGQRIQLAPEAIVADLDRLAERLERPAESMVMISRRQMRSNNSWMHNYPRLMRGKDRCTLLVHPDDASRLDLRASQQVKVTSRVGEIVVPIEISEEIMPGVVCLPHGWGHHRPEIRLSVAQQHAGQSINDLTDEHCIDALSGNAALSGLAVTLDPVCDPG